MIHHVHSVLDSGGIRKLHDHRATVYSGPCIYLMSVLASQPHIKDPFYIKRGFYSVTNDHGSVRSVSTTIVNFHIECMVPKSFQEESRICSL